MSLLGRLGLRLRSRGERNRLESEMNEELARHLELETEKKIGRGMSPDEARRVARLAFGGADRVAEECRESWGARRLDELRQDLRLGARSLRRSPGYALAVIVTLALGIGANTAVFSVVRGVLMRPLPYGGGGDRLVALRQPAPTQGSPDLGFSVLELGDYRSQLQELEAVVEYHSMNFTLYGGAEPLRVQTGVVSANYFDMLEVKPILGRAFLPGEDALGAEAVLVLSHRFWREAFGGDPTVVGRHFQMNDRPHTVVGVLPPLPAYPDANDVFMPASACPFRSNPQSLADRGVRAVSAFGKLKPNRTLAQATTEANGLVARLQQQFADAYPKGGAVAIELSPVRDEMTRGARKTFLLLLGTVALILLVACANVANLALARLSDRGHEMALRAALGGGRRRLLRQLLTESTLLALIGGALGLLLAWAAKGMLVGFAARFTTRAAEISIDGTVLAFTLLVSVGTGLVFGSLPGLPKSDALARSVVGGTRSTASLGRKRMRRALVVGQLALSFVLLVVAALALRSLWRLNEVDAGFKSENVLTAQIHLNWSTYLSPEHAIKRDQVVAFHDRLASELGALPGVVEVGQAWTVPLNAAFSNGGQFQVEGREIDPNAPIRAIQIGASRDYFEAVAVPVLKGEPFRGDEDGREPLKTLVSREFARRYFPNEDPVGKRISGNNGRSWRTIVGVVGDVRQSDLRQEPEPMAYVPFTEFPGFSSYVFIRSLGDPRPLERELRKLVLAGDAQAAISDVRTLELLRTDALAAPRLATMLLSLFAFVALAISATGLGGVLAYSVSQRTQEIGVRMALGAAPRKVLAEIVGEGLRTTLLGLTLGLIGALAASRLLTGMLFGVSPTDAACIAASAATLLVTSFVACLLPGHRAVNVQPVSALRV